VWFFQYIFGPTEMEYYRKRSLANVKSDVKWYDYVWSEALRGRVAKQRRLRELHGKNGKLIVLLKPIYCRCPFYEWQYLKGDVGYIEEEIKTIKKHDFAVRFDGLNLESQTHALGLGLKAADENIVWKRC
jgi:hypothetical protein